MSLVSVTAIISIIFNRLLSKLFSAMTSTSIQFSCSPGRALSSKRSSSIHRDVSQWIKYQMTWFCLWIEISRHLCKICDEFRCFWLYFMFYPRALRWLYGCKCLFSLHYACPNNADPCHRFRPNNHTVRHSIQHTLNPGDKGSDYSVSKWNEYLGNVLWRHLLFTQYLYKCSVLTAHKIFQLIWIFAGFLMFCDRNLNIFPVMEHFCNKTRHFTG